MLKGHHPHAAAGNAGWSVGSGNLTEAGRSELLKDLGRQMQHNYRSMLQEPAPDRIKHLLERLESVSARERHEDL
ncbi:hypothetical protein ILT44_24140 [Microvirga sp. BT689]|uniref:NepR family anti-sigma factor n=1 Tax=Microvirga arvi TaxID=2778731 RepID=UPI001951DBBF|nr:hypothetical protein [Microvirga arvi]